MKKKLLVVLIVIATIVCSVALCGCKEKYLYFLPEVSSNVEGIAIEHINNFENDYIFPTGDKLSHQIYVDEHVIQSAFLIKKTDGELLGWIFMDFSSEDNKYGFGADLSNDIPFYDQSISVYLLTSDKTIFSRFTMEPNNGNIEFSQDFEPNFEEGIEKVDLVSGVYRYNLSSINPNDITDGIKIKVNIA